MVFQYASVSDAPVHTASSQLEGEELRMENMHFRLETEQLRLDIQKRAEEKPTLLQQKQCALEENMKLTKDFKAYQRRHAFERKQWEKEKSELLLGQMETLQAQLQKLEEELLARDAVIAKLREEQMASERDAAHSKNTLREAEHGHAEVLELMDYWWQEAGKLSVKLEDAQELCEHQKQLLLEKLDRQRREDHKHSQAQLLAGAAARDWDVLQAKLRAAEEYCIATPTKSKGDDLAAVISATSASTSKVTVSAPSDGASSDACQSVPPPSPPCVASAGSTTATSLPEQQHTTPRPTLLESPFGWVSLVRDACASNSKVDCVSRAELCGESFEVQETTIVPDRPSRFPFATPLRSPPSWCTGDARSGASSLDTTKTPSSLFSVGRLTTTPPCSDRQTTIPVATPLKSRFATLASLSDFGAGLAVGDRSSPVAGKTSTVACPFSTPFQPPLQIDVHEPL